MKVNMIKINNFKSIGEKDNILTIDKLNVIIGKNESGKSNIIEALSKIDITGINDSSFFKNMNKINRKYPTFELELEPYSYELKKYSHLTKMHIFIKSQFDIEFDGGYEYYINNDKDFVKVKKRIFEILEENPVPFQKKENIDNLKTFLNSIKNADSKVFLYLTYMDDLLNAMQRVTYDYKEELIEKFRFCIKFLMKFHELFPTFFAIDDFQLNSSYPKEQIISDKNIIRCSGNSC